MTEITPAHRSWARSDVDCFLADSQSFVPTLSVTAQRVHTNRTWEGPRGSVLTAQAGDWLLSDGRSEWVVARAVFQETYSLQPDGRYRKSARVRARRLEDATLVKTLEGDVAAKPGDWVVQNPTGDFWPVTDIEFKRRYRPA